MIRFLPIIFFVLTALFGLNAEEFFQGQILDEIEKIEYVHPSQIFFTQNAIYVSIGGKLTQVGALFSEGNGICLQKKFPSGERRWQCPKCNHVNDKGAKICDVCRWNSKTDPIWDPSWDEY